MANYFEEEDLANDRIPMLWACLGIHAVLGAVVFLAFYQWNMPVLDQLIHSGNRNLLSMLILTSASCIIGLVVTLAVTASQLKRSTAWMLGLAAAPALIAILAVFILTSG